MVTPFRAQANAIREIVLADNQLAHKLIEMEFLVDTAHKFQGDERDVMIFSPVVSNPEQVSDWEKILYEALYDAGIATLPQYSIEKYALDLALIDGERKLDIEVDGEKYHRNWSGEHCYRDQLRNQRMFELGWDVMRFWVYEVRDDMESCVERVREWHQNV